MASQLPISRLVSVGMNFFGAGVTGAAAASTPAAVTVAPSIVQSPSINGVPQVGVQLSITSGIFSGTPAPSVTRVIAVAGTPVANGPASSTNYTPVTADIGKTIIVTDTAANGTLPNAVAPSSASAAVIAASTNVAPAVVSVPAVNGTPTVGTALSITAGVFSGDPTPTVSRSIYAAGTLVGTTGYTPVTADIGKVFTVVEVATNGVSPDATSMSANSATCVAAPVAQKSGAVNTYAVGTYP